jgi:hypothetical protein
VAWLSASFNHPGNAAHTKKEVKIVDKIEIAEPQSEDIAARKERNQGIWNVLD